MPELGGDFVFDEVAVEIPLMVREDQTRDLGTCMVRAKLFEIFFTSNDPMICLLNCLLIVCPIANCFWIDVVLKIYCLLIVCSNLY